MTRRKVWIGALGVLLLTASLVGWAVWRQAQRVAAIRAAGHPVTLEDLRPKPVPEDQNAAVALADAAGAWRAFDKAYAAFEESALGKSWRDRLNARQPPTVEQLEAIRGLLADHQAAIDSADEAARRPVFAAQHPADAYSRPKALMQAVIEAPFLLKSAARMNRLRVALALAEGRSDDAVSLAEGTLRLGELAEGRLLMIGFLSALGVKLAGFHQVEAILGSDVELSDASIDRLDQALAACDERESLRKAIAQERAYAGQSVKTLGPIGWLSRGAMARYFEEQLALCSAPTAEVAKLLKRPPGRSTWIGSWTVDLLRPGLESAHAASLRTLAQARTLRVLLAARETPHLSDETSIADQLGLPNAAMLDPHTGEPLTIYHDEKDGKATVSVSAKVYTASH